MPYVDWDKRLEHDRELYRTSPDKRARVRAATNKYRWGKFGSTQVDYDRIWEEQGHLCAGCGTDKATKWCFDHNHATGKARGILCHNCNVMAGLAKDSPDRLIRLAVYLEK